MVTGLGFVISSLFLTPLTDGHVYPLMTSVLKVQGDPKRFATYIGILQFSIGLIAMVIGPTLTIQLAVHMNWQYAFIFTSLPTVILGIIIWFGLKEKVHPATGGLKASPMETPPIKDNNMRWKDVPRIFTYRNCTLSYIANEKNNHNQVNIIFFLTPSFNSGIENYIQKLPLSGRTIVQKKTEYKYKQN